MRRMWIAAPGAKLSQRLGRELSMRTCLPLWRAPPSPLGAPCFASQPAGLPSSAAMWNSSVGVQACVSMAGRSRRRCEARMRRASR